MSSGQAKTREWVLEFVNDTAREVDPLMGWTSSGDMKQQLKLKFPTREEAENYARREGIAFTVVEPKKAKPKSKSYSDNFKWGRQDNWTH